MEHDQLKLQMPDRQESEDARGQTAPVHTEVLGIAASLSVDHRRLHEYQFVWGFWGLDDNRLN